jgi:hypothetical protein
MSSGMGPDAPSPRAGERGVAGRGGRPGGDRDAWPCGGVHDGEPGWLAGLRLVAAIASRAEHAAGVVAAPGMATVRPEEHVLSAAAVLQANRLSRTGPPALPGALRLYPQFCDTFDSW